MAKHSGAVTRIGKAADRVKYASPPTTPATAASQTGDPSSEERSARRRLPRKSAVNHNSGIKETLNKTATGFRAAMAHNTACSVTENSYRLTNSLTSRTYSGRATQASNIAQGKF